MILINQKLSPQKIVNSLDDARKLRDAESKSKEDKHELSFFFYENNGKSKEICIDSFNDDSELFDENIFTENEVEGRFNVFEWGSGERKDRQGVKYSDFLNTSLVGIAAEKKTTSKTKRKNG